jgi:hypothetical protein
MRALFVHGDNVTTKILTYAIIPDELRTAWLQHLRDFDNAHPDCHFEIIADAQSATVREMIETLHGVNPGFEFMKAFIKD